MKVHIAHIVDRSAKRDFIATAVLALQMQGSPDAPEGAVDNNPEPVAERLCFVEGVRGEEHAELVSGNAFAERVPHQPTAQRICTMGRKTRSRSMKRGAQRI